MSNNRRLILGAGVMTLILVNGVTYRPAVRLIKKSGLKGYWPVNLTTLAVMGGFNCLAVGSLMGWFMSREVNHGWQKIGVPQTANY